MQRTWHFSKKNAQAMCNPAQVAQLWVALMAAQMMVQQQGGGQSTTGWLTNSEASGFKDREPRARGRCS